MAQRVNRLPRMGTGHAPPRSRPSGPLSGAAKHPAGARPSKCIIVNNKSLIAMQIDFSNAFGSVPHGLFLNGMTQLGFPSTFTDLTRNACQHSTSVIPWRSTRSRRSRTLIRYRVEVGRKQGCSFSPLLFNICIGETRKSRKGKRGSNL
jgi:hypothetical protein